MEGHDTKKQQHSVHKEGTFELNANMKSSTTSLFVYLGGYESLALTLNLGQKTH